MTRHKRQIRVKNEFQSLLYQNLNVRLQEVEADWGFGLFPLGQLLLTAHLAHALKDQQHLQEAFWNAPELNYHCFSWKGAKEQIWLLCYVFRPVVCVDGLLWELGWLPALFDFLFITFQGGWFSFVWELSHNEPFFILQYWRMTIILSALKMWQLVTKVDTGRTSSFLMVPTIRDLKTYSLLLSCGFLSSHHKSPNDPAQQWSRSRPL